MPVRHDSYLHLPCTFSELYLEQLHPDDIPDAREIIEHLQKHDLSCKMLQPLPNKIFGPDVNIELAHFFMEAPSKCDFHIILRADMILFIHDKHGRVLSVVMIEFRWAREPDSRLGAHIQYTETLLEYRGMNYFQVLCNAAEQFMLHRLLVAEPNDTFFCMYQNSGDGKITLLLPHPFSSFRCPIGFVETKQEEQAVWLHYPEDHVTYERILDFSLGERDVDQEEEEVSSPLAPPPTD